MVYGSTYSESWALVIGINDYEHAPPLSYARHDAEAVAAVLEDKFGFKNSNIVKLYDREANRDSIMNAFLQFTTDSYLPDDRLIVFYAGHGYTSSAKRGDVGYLVPANGNVANPATLIRWDELTRNSDLILAKHLLFIMDACYGGLAITRKFRAGSMRFL